MAEENVAEFPTIDLGAFLPNRPVYRSIFMAVAIFGALKRMHDTGHQKSAIELLKTQYGTLDKVVEVVRGCPRCKKELEGEDLGGIDAAAVVLNNYFNSEGDFARMLSSAQSKLEMTSQNVPALRKALEISVAMLVDSIVTIIEKET